MKKFRRIIFSILIAALICASCFRVDRGYNEVNVSNPNNAGIESETVNEYLPVRTEFYDDIDFRMSRSKPGK